MIKDINFAAIAKASPKALLVFGRWLQKEYNYALIFDEDGIGSDQHIDVCNYFPHQFLDEFFDIEGILGTTIYMGGKARFFYAINGTTRQSNVFLTRADAFIAMTNERFAHLEKRINGELYNKPSIF